MKVSGLLLLLLSANLAALATANWDTCSEEFSICGLLHNDFANGVYMKGPINQDYDVGYSNQYSYKVKREGENFIIYHDELGNIYVSPDMPGVTCLEDVSSMTFKLASDENKSEVATIKKGDTGCPVVAETTTAAPTPCPPCRNVMTGPMKGNYKHAGSGDARCTYDGCLYTKDSELYCFQTGSETVQEVCPT